MFWKKGKKKNKKDAKNKVNARITVIPEIFYGGKDPLIYHEQHKKPAVKTKQKKLKSKGKVKLPISNKKIAIISVVVLILVIAGASFYYFIQGSVEAPKITPPVKKPIVKEEPKEVEVPEEKEEPEEVAEEEPVEEPEEVAEEETQTTVTFPNILLRDSADIDIDSLTDQEEEVFQSDSGIWDSDKDGYYDGQEVFNLYNPKGFAPVKIIDSGLVREYINPKWQYRLYYPTVWEAAGVDTENNHVIFSSITGDFVEVRAFQKLPSENFAAWFAKTIEGQSFTDLSLFSNRFKIDGYKRKDSLTAYFVAPNAVFVMIYQPSGAAVDVPYRHIMQMMYQSFRPSAVYSELPAQTVLPQVP